MVNNTALSANDDKTIKMHDGGTGPGRVHKAELMRHSKIKQLNIMINFDGVTGKNTQDSSRWVCTWY